MEREEVCEIGGEASINLGTITQSKVFCFIHMNNHQANN